MKSKEKTCSALVFHKKVFVNLETDVQALDKELKKFIRKKRIKAVTDIVRVCYCKCFY